MEKVKVYVVTEKMRHSDDLVAVFGTRQAAWRYREERINGDCDGPDSITIEEYDVRD